MAEEIAPKSERNPGDGFISKKLGPFPLWGWAVIAAAAIGVLFVIRKQQAGSQSAAVGDMANAGSGVGVMSADPLSMAGLTESVQQLTQQLKGTSNGGPVPTQAGILGQLEQAPTGFPSQGPGSVPVTASPTSTQIIGWVPFASDIPIIGPAVQGRAAAGGSTSWLPVNWGGQTGYISSEGFTGFTDAMGRALSTPPTAGGGLNAASTSQAPA